MARSKYFGFNAPFIGGQQSYMSRQVDERLIKNDLLQLILTSPGERVMRPNFGTPVRMTPFDQNDDVTKDFLMDRISEAISRHDNRVEITNLEIANGADEDEIQILVYGYIKNRDSYTSDNDLLIELNIPRGKLNVPSQGIR